jgi:hypothetical protein
MAKTEDHIRQWKHNRYFLVSIPPEYPDWFVTVAFYVALQAVDALLAHDRVTGITSHESRKIVMMRTNKYKRVELAFLPL